MSDAIELLAVDPPEHHGAKRATSMDVVFIHGLGGDLDTTWRHSPTAWWPQWVADDHPHVQVWCLGYPAKIGHLVQLGDSTQLDSKQLAVALGGRMRNKCPGIGSRPCIFVCHSLGGLIAKQILHESSGRTDWDAFGHANVGGVMFLGTPHRGSAVANVLQTLDGIKHVSLKVLSAVLPLSAAWLAGSVLTTTKLLDELQEDNRSLQWLNEWFCGYHVERCQQGDFKVCSYAETKPMQVAGMSTHIVVDRDSANPNVRPRADAPPIPVHDVPGADHTTLVKPSTRDSAVPEALRKLIEEVANASGAFDLGDPLRNQVAHKVFLALRKRPGLLNLPSFARSATAQGQSAEQRARKLTEFLCAQGGDVLDGLGLVRQALESLACLRDTERADLAALEQVGGMLVLLAMQTPVLPTAPAAVGTERHEFEVPLVDGLSLADTQSVLDLLIELCHSTLRQWPSRWSLSADRTAVLPGSWILESPALSHPSSWRAHDHLTHLVGRVVASAPEGMRPQRSKLPTESDSAQSAESLSGATEPAITLSNADRLRLANARRLLQERFNSQIGLVIDAVQPNSPYQSEALRSQVATLFGGLVAVALPSPPAGSADELIGRIGALQAAIHQFTLQAHDAHNQVQTHAR